MPPHAGPSRQTAHCGLHWLRLRRHHAAAAHRKNTALHSPEEHWRRSVVNVSTRQWQFHGDQPAPSRMGGLRQSWVQVLLHRSGYHESRCPRFGTSHQAGFGRSGAQRRPRERDFDISPLPCSVAYRDHQRRVLLDRVVGIRAESRGIKCIRFSATRRGLDFTGRLLRATRQKCWALPGSVASSFTPLDSTGPGNWTLPGRPKPATAGPRPVMARYGPGPGASTASGLCRWCHRATRLPPDRRPAPIPAFPGSAA